MDDKLLSLAFSVEAGKGEYALLLGSGLSSSAGIPTGWGIVVKLCQCIMALEAKNVEEDPVTWYQNTYEAEPLYDTVIKKLARQSIERNNLLKEFFEPTNEDKEEGRKIPTEAHHAIAEMVQQGYIKVIVTTNFDRLIEQALEQRNIKHKTLYHDDDIKGMKPLVHSECIVLKINGDYKDIRFKNIETELNNYSEPLIKLLEQIFDEYGMIVSGWSAKWDTKLRNIITSVTGRRYSWYWHAYTEKLNDEAKHLIEFRDGNKIVDTGGAENFFKELSENVSGIAKFKKVNPENSQVILTQFKKYISDNREIDVNDMMSKYTQEVMSYLKEQNYTYHGDSIEDILSDRIEEIKEKCKILAMLSATLAYYGKTDDHKNLLFKTLERLTETQKNNYDNSLLFTLQKIPLHAILYSTGISMVMQQNYKWLRELFHTPKIRNHHSNYDTFLEDTSLFYNLDSLFKHLNTKKYYFPVQTIFINPYMRQLFMDTHLSLSEKEFDIGYDIFEFLVALLYRFPEKRGYFIGQFSTKDDYDRQHINQLLKMARNENSPVLDICNGDKEAFHNALRELVNVLNGMSFERLYKSDGLLEAYEGSQ